MDDLFNKFLITMRARNFAQSTIDHYQEDLRIFLAHVGKDILAVTHEDVTRFQAELVERGYSAGHINKKVAALKMFYIRTLRMNWPQDFAPWVRKKQRLP